MRRMPEATHTQEPLFPGVPGPSAPGPSAPTCAWCKQPFRPRKSWQKFCSPAHRKEAFRAEQKPEELVHPAQEPLSPLEGALAAALAAVRRGADLQSDGLLERLRGTIDAAYPLAPIVAASPVVAALDLEELRERYKRAIQGGVVAAHVATAVQCDPSALSKFKSGARGLVPDLARKLVGWLDEQNA